LSFLLDTNAFSEITRPRPNSGYVDWFEGVNPEDLYLSSLTIGEVRRGVCLLATGPRRDLLERATRDLQGLFEGRILAFDTAIAHAWGELGARHRSSGRIIGAVDEMLAATALVHDLTLVTRNVRHFEAAGCPVICPWSN
jgi:predicted nucleic acid-binding protein